MKVGVVLKKIGLISFFVGVIIILIYSVSMLLSAQDVTLWVKIAMILIIAGVVIILYKELQDKKKNKEEEDDFSKY